MKIWVDTNVLIDYIADRKEFSKDAESIFLLSNIYWELYLSSLSFVNMVYILRKEINPEKLAITNDYLKNNSNLISLNPEDIDMAISLDLKDFEDALQTAGAIRVQADYIVTRNINDFADSPIKAILPRDLLNKIMQ